MNKKEPSCYSSLGVLVTILLDFSSGTSGFPLGGPAALALNAQVPTQA